MKKYNCTLINTIALIGLTCLAFLNGCKGTDPEPDFLTNKTWSIQSVHVDDIDKTTLFSNMKLAFTDGDYTTINGGDTWPASGTWAYASGSTTKIIRDNELEIAIEELTNAQLTLTLQWAKTTFGGRVGSVQGKNVFVFNSATR